MIITKKTKVIMWILYYLDDIIADKNRGYYVSI